MTKINNVIQRMGNDKEYKEYFFRNASKYQNLHLWLIPLNKKGYFNPQNNPEPIESEENKGSFHIPHWEVLSFLEAVSLQNNENLKKEITKELISIIDKIINYRKVDGTRIDNYFTDWDMIKIIFNLPMEEIKIDYIKFISTSLKEARFTTLLGTDIEKIVLPFIIRNKMKKHLLELLKIIFDYCDKKTESYQEREPLIEKYWLDSLLQKHSKKIIDIISIDGLNILVEIINKVIEEDTSAFNNVWIRTIEAHSQNTFPDRYDNQLISFIRDLLESLKSDDIKDLVESFLKKEHPIFKRLAFHIINHKYDELKDIFWYWFDKEITTLNSTFRHEIYKLIDDRSDKFITDEYEKLITWIESLDYSNYNIEDIDSYNAYKKREWLLTIKDNYSKASELYEQYTKINNNEIEHPGFDSWSSGITRHVHHNYIKVEDNFCDKDINDIVTYINNFDYSKVEKKRFDRDSDVLESVARELSKCLKANLFKFTNNIEEFHKVDYIYKYYLITTLKKVWMEKEIFNLKKVFDFIDKELDDSFFQSKEQYSRWIKGEIANLIEDGTKDDSNAFNKELLPKAKEILFKLIENKEEEESTNFDDLLTHVLNSNNGKTLHALMSYSLRYARLNSSNKVKWENDVKSFFTLQLKENTIYSKSLFSILGQYLPNFIYLDKKWTEENINKIFPKNNDGLWEISISSYFGYCQVYEDIYNLLKKNSHFEKFLTFSFNSKNIKRRIVEHICVMYINNKDDETIFKVIETKDDDFILEIIRFMSFEKKEKSEQVLLLWDKIFEEMKDDNKKEIFSNLAQWFYLIDEIDDDLLVKLKLTASYIEVHNHNCYKLFEEMERLVNTQSKYISQLYLDMLENDIRPIIQQKEILYIMEKLFQSKYESALKISNLYKKHGIYILNDLSKKYQKNGEN